MELIWLKLASKKIAVTNEKRRRHLCRFCFFLLRDSLMTRPITEGKSNGCSTRATRGGARMGELVNGFAKFDSAHSGDARRSGHARRLINDYEIGL
jgi:hypothetical protein